MHGGTGTEDRTDATGCSTMLGRIDVHCMHAYQGIATDSSTAAGRQNVATPSNSPVAPAVVHRARILEASYLWPGGRIEALGVDRNSTTPASNTGMR